MKKKAILLVISFAFLWCSFASASTYAAIGDPYYCNSLEDLSYLLRFDLSSVTIESINCSPYVDLKGTTVTVSYIEPEELSAKPYYREIDNEHIPDSQIEKLHAIGIDISQVVNHGLAYGSCLVNGWVGQYYIDWYQIDDADSAQKEMLIICKIPGHISGSFISNDNPTTATYR